MSGASVEKGTKIRVRWHIACTLDNSSCHHCIRHKNAVGMIADAVQLVVVFTIVPVIPFAILETHVSQGAWWALAAGALFYGGYPLAFGAAMWLDQSRTAKRSA